MEHPIVKATPIYFSQTREDPMVEINALFQRQNETRHPLTICLIASGGDTLCSILSNKRLKIKRIDVIDINPHQIQLTQFKLGLIQMFNGYFNKQFLSHGSCKESLLCASEKQFENYSSKGEINALLLALFNNKFISRNTYTYWKDHISILCKGVNQYGRFELLFKIVMRQENFDLHFSHNNLSKIFGANAVMYSMNKNFSEHFSGILSAYRNIYSKPDENYFYHQFVFNSYGSDVPPYLQNENPIKINSKIGFHVCDMMSHLIYIPDATYDLIHLSNITDWLDPFIFDKLLNEIGRTLKMRGKAILRRLNSNTEIRFHLMKYNCSQSQYKFFIESDIFDKSHFYSEVVILTKLSDSTDIIY